MPLGSEKRLRFQLRGWTDADALEELRLRRKCLADATLRRRCGSVNRAAASLRSLRSRRPVGSKTCRFGGGQGVTRGHESKRGRLSSARQALSVPTPKMYG